MIISTHHISLHTMDKHFQSVNGFGCGNKQDVTLLSAKTDVGCPVLGNGEMGYLLPILVEYGHAVASQIIVHASMNSEFGNLSFIIDVLLNVSSIIFNLIFIKF